MGLLYYSLSFGVYLKFSIIKHVLKSVCKNLRNEVFSEFVTTYP